MTLNHILRLITCQELSRNFPGTFPGTFQELFQELSRNFSKNFSRNFSRNFLRLIMGGTCRKSLEKLNNKTDKSKKNAAFPPMPLGLIREKENTAVWRRCRVSPYEKRKQYNGSTQEEN